MKSNPRGYRGTQMSGLPLHHARAEKGALCGATRKWGVLTACRPEDVECHRCRKKLLESGAYDTKSWEYLTLFVKNLQRERTWTPKLHGGPTTHPRNFNWQDLVRGALVELEHTDDPRIAVEIAVAHLEEDRDYYAKLAKMEGRKSNPSRWRRLLR